MNERQKRLMEVYDELRNYHGIHTKNGFAEAIDYGRTSLSAAMNGNESYLTDSLFRNICYKFPFFNLDYLLTGEGKLLKDDQGFENVPRIKTDQTIDQSSLVNAALAAKDQTIAQLELRISEKDKYIAMLEKRIADYEAAAEFIKENDFLEKYSFTRGVAEPCDYKRK